MSATEDHKESQVYELGYLVLPSIAEDALPDVVNTLKGIIKKVGAQELDSEDPITIDLAYTMSKTVGARKYVVDSAYIGWIKFETEPENVAEIHDAVAKLDEILRFLVIKTERETRFTFAQARQREEERQQALEEAAKAASEAPAEPADKVVE